MTHVKAVLVLVVGLAATAVANEGPNFAVLMNQGNSLVQAKKTDEAISVYKKAVKLNSASGEAMYRLASLYLQAHAYKDAVSVCQHGQQQNINASWQLLLHGLAGQAYEEQAAEGERKFNQSKLQLAESEYRVALALPETAEAVQTQLGRVLMKQGRDEEGKAELQNLLLRPASALTQNDSWRHYARQLLENPRRAREMFLPDFAITTLSGERITSDRLLGKIVVLDFWATWCPSCRASMPRLRDLAKKYAAGPVVVLSVSSDADEAKWKQYVVAQQMNWLQYRDADSSLQKLFGVRAIPAFVVVDAEGFIRQAALGEEGLAWIEEAVKKNLKALEKTRTAHRS